MKELKLNYAKVLTWGDGLPLGGYLVRFYDEIANKYCYVVDGSDVSYAHWDDAKFEPFSGVVKITSENSEKFFIKREILRGSSPQDNGDIDYFIELENGQILAKAVAGYGFYRVPKKSLETDSWGDFDSYGDAYGGEA